MSMLNALNYEGLQKQQGKLQPIYRVSKRRNWLLTPLLFISGVCLRMAQRYCMTIEVVGYDRNAETKKTIH